VSDALEVTDKVAIPRDELSIRATRSGGAGGQHVNTSSTRIELLWNVEQSRALPDEVREGVLQRLRSRTNAEGYIRIVSSEHRSQLRNREAAEERLVKLVRGALTVPRARRKTAPTRASKEARLQAKKRRAEIKKRRSREDFE
jgi:ribosome-associated protein